MSRTISKFQKYDMNYPRPIFGAFFLLRVSRSLVVSYTGSNAIMCESCERVRNRNPYRFANFIDGQQSMKITISCVI